MTNDKQPQNRRTNMIILLAVIVIVVLVALVYFFFNGNTGMASPPTREQEQEAAADALVILQNLAVDNYELLGFTSPEEAQNASLDASFNVLFVGLEQLQAYEAGSDTSAMLMDTGVVFYSVAVDGTVRSSVQVQGTDAGWTPVGFGSASLIRAITALEMPADVDLVQVPALGLYFIATEDDGAQLLTPVFDNELYGFVAGEALDIARVFEIIQAAAREIEPDAPM